MLTAVSATNPRGSTLQLPFVAASGITVREITGLDPVAASLSTSSIAQRDGAQPQNSRRDVRNIVMKLGLEPDWATQTVQSLRFQLYDYFMTKANVRLGFYIDDNLFVTTYGQVEDFNAPQFTQDPEADISVICYDPDFYAVAPVEQPGTTRTDSVPTVISYPGTSDAGVIFNLLVDRNLSEVSIFNRTPSNVIQRMTVDGTFFPNDQVIINTIEGQRAITLIRNGLPSPAITGYDLTGSWITLQQGDNEFRAVTAVAGVPYDMVYTPAYGGL